MVTTGTLRGIGNTKLYEIELYRRTADPVTIIIVTIIGMAVASRKVRGGMGLHLALGVAMGAIFIFVAKFSITFATNEALPAWVGVWLPNLVFAGLHQGQQVCFEFESLFSSFSSRKETISSRTL